MKKLLAVILALCLSASLVACGNSNDTNVNNPDDSANSATQQTPDNNSTSAEDVYTELALGSTAKKYNGHFDPTAALNDNVSNPCMSLVYDCMFYMAGDGTAYTTDIFGYYEFDTENLQVVLTLRDDVYFASGDQMVGEDIVYTLQRAKLVARQATTFSYILIDQATVSSDGLTITIPMSSDYGPWMTLFGRIGVLNKSWVDSLGGADAIDWTDPAQIDGSGPYVVTEYVEETYTVYEKRGDWWLEGEFDGAEFDKITVYSYSDNTTMMVDYETGMLNMVIGLTSADYDRICEDSSLGTAVKASSNVVATIVMDTTYNQALTDINLRKAIVYGTDTAAVAEVAYGSLYEPAKGFLASTNPYFVEGYSYEYNPSLAKQIVEENGLNGTVLKMVVPSGTNATIAESFQWYMEEIGITVELEVYDQATCISMWSQEGCTAFMIDQNSNVNSSNDAYQQYLNLVSTKDFPCMRRLDAAWNELVNGGKANSNPTIRADYYAQLQALQYDLYSELPICEWQYAYCYDNSVAGAAVTDTMGPDLRTIYPAV